MADRSANTAASSSRPSPYGQREKSSTRLFVGNLSSSVSEHDLVQLFHAVGPITKLDVVFHKAGPLKGKPKGFAFVEYAKEEHATEAARSLDGRKLRGQELSVGFANVSNDPPSRRTNPSDEHKPTALSLVKDAAKPKSTAGKIAAMEAKLAALRNSRKAPASSSSTLCAMTHVLDLDCPVAWPSAVGTASSTAIPCPTRLPSRYVESLYLGEHHSPLAGFLAHVVAESRRTSPHDLRDALIGLLHTPDELASRGDALRQRLPDILTGKCKDNGAGPLGPLECRIIRDALSHGPGSAAGQEMRRAIESQGESQGESSADLALVGSVSRRWLSAMSNREVQLQILVLLALLRLGAAVTRASDAPAPPTAPPTRKHRKRKNVAKRYVGLGGAAFPWSAPAAADDDDAELRPTDNDAGQDAESLNRRLEGATDRLCLRLVTDGLGLNAHGTTLLFGSSARPAVTDSRDSRDELQWLLQDVIEPHFGLSLPRQCAAIRNKCFVPGAGGLTPARPVAAPTAAARDEERADLDLVSRGKRAAEHQRAKLQAEVSKRPRLEDALRREGSRARLGHASRSNHIGEREVSVSRTFARSQSMSSVGGAAEGERLSAPLPAPLPAPPRRKFTAMRRPDEASTQTIHVSPRKTVSSRARELAFAARAGARQTEPRAWQRAESQPVLRAPHDDDDDASDASDAIEVPDQDEEEERVPVRRSSLALSQFASAFAPRGAQAPFARSVSASFSVDEEPLQARKLPPAMRISSFARHSQPISPALPSPDAALDDGSPDEATPADVSPALASSETFEAAGLAAKTMTTAPPRSAPSGRNPFAARSTGKSLRSASLQIADEEEDHLTPAALGRAWRDRVGDGGPD